MIIFCVIWERNDLFFFSSFLKQCFIHWPLLWTVALDYNAQLYRPDQGLLYIIYLKEKNGKLTRLLLYSNKTVVNYVKGHFNT